MDNVQDNGQQPDLFPEDMSAGAGDPSATDPMAAPAGGDLAAQLASMTPEQVTQLAATLPPDIRSMLAQSLFAAMSPEEQQAVDSVPGGDVQDGMDDAVPQRPEQQYQMSIVRTQKRLSHQPGTEALVNDHVERWSNRLTSLFEDGFLDEKTHKEMQDKLSHPENKFSIILKDYGLVRDTIKQIEILEKLRAGQAVLSKSVLSNRFSTARPALPPRSRKNEIDGFDEKQAEEAGKRLASMY